MNNLKSLLFFILLCASQYSIAAPSAGNDESECQSSPFFEAAHSLSVSKLRRCADLLVMRKQITADGCCEDAIRRHFINFLQLKEMSGISKSSRASYIDDYAKVIALFRPKTLASAQGNIIKNLRGNSKLSFLICIINKCFKVDHWNKLLHEQLSVKHKKLLSTIFRVRKKSPPLSTKIKKLNEMLSKQFAKNERRAIIPWVILTKSMKQNQSNKTADVIHNLLKQRRYAYHTVRCITLKSFPARIIEKMSKIASDQTLKWGIRLAALRAYGLHGKQPSLFADLPKWQKQLSKAGSKERNTTWGRKEYMYASELLKWSKTLFDFRKTPKSERHLFLVHRTLEGQEVLNPQLLGKIFYPKRYFLQFLNRLENTEKIPKEKRSCYQVGLLIAEEINARGYFEKQLVNRLKINIRKLNGWRKVPIMHAIAGTYDLENFGVPLIQCYAANKGKSISDTGGICSQIISIFFRWKQQDIDVINFLKGKKEKMTDKENKETIEILLDRLSKWGAKH